MTARQRRGAETTELRETFPTAPVHPLSDSGEGLKLRLSPSSVNFSPTLMLKVKITCIVARYAASAKTCPSSLVAVLLKEHLDLSGTQSYYI